MIKSGSSEATKAHQNLNFLVSLLIKGLLLGPLPFVILFSDQCYQNAAGPVWQFVRQTVPDWVLSANPI